jgi:hypothetical protein
VSLMWKLLALILLAAVQSSCRMASGEFPEEWPSAGPAGIDAELWAQLVKQLESTIAASANDRAGAGVPLSSSAQVADLKVLTDGAGSAWLHWSYANPGDYDRNSEVNIADLVPIGLNFGATTDSENWSAAQVADGDGNGEVNLADVTPIGVNFTNAIDSYGAEYASGPDGPWTNAGSVGFEALGADSGIPGTFAMHLNSAPDGWYRVTPIYLGAEGLAGTAAPWLYTQTELIPVTFENHALLFSSSLSSVQTLVKDPVPGGSVFRCWHSATDKNFTVAVIMNWDNPEQAVNALQQLVDDKTPIDTGEAGFYSENSLTADGFVAARVAACAGGNRTLAVISGLYSSEGTCAAKDSLLSLLADTFENLDAGSTSAAARHATVCTPGTQRKGAASIQDEILPPVFTQILSGPGGLANGTLHMGMRMRRLYPCNESGDGRYMWEVLPFAQSIDLLDDTDYSGGATIEYSGELKVRFGEEATARTFPIELDLLQYYTQLGALIDTVGNTGRTDLYNDPDHRAMFGDQRILCGAAGYLPARPTGPQKHFEACGRPKHISIELSFQDVDSATGTVAWKATQTVAGAILLIPETGGWSIFFGIAGILDGAYDIASEIITPSDREPLGRIFAQWDVPEPEVTVSLEHRADSQPSGGVPHAVRLRALAYSAAGIAAYSWDLNGDGIYGDPSENSLDKSPELTTDYIRTPGQHEISVKVTDNYGAVATASTAVSAEGYSIVLSAASTAGTVDPGNTIFTPELNVAISPWPSIQGHWILDIHNGHVSDGQSPWNIVYGSTPFEIHGPAVYRVPGYFDVYATLVDSQASSENTFVWESNHIPISVTEE